MSSQELIEEILLDAARATGLVEVHFRTEATRLLEGGDAHDTKARLEVRDLTSNATTVLEGPAVVGADGAASLIRDQLGVRLEGRQELSHMVNCYFRADIEPHVGDRKGVLLFVSNAEVRGVLQPLDAAGRWLCQINVPVEDWSPEAFPKERVARWIKSATGIDTLEPEVLSVGFWKLNATVVEQLARGRVVLCGDAAHQFPPTGGLGVNTGLQGMHNAMWKLALCIRGEAGWPLLDTYDIERRDVARRITEQSLENSINVGRIQAAALSGGDSGLSTDDVLTTSRRYGNHLGVEFGAVYRSPAVIADGTAPPAVADSYSDYIQCATPGCRAPHAWLGQPQARLSTLDLFAAGFTLLGGEGAVAWRQQAEAAAAELGVRIDVYQLGAAGLADTGDVAATYAIGDAGAVLVRPDGHVAWRSATPPGSDRELIDVFRRVLAR